MTDVAADKPGIFNLRDMLCTEDGIADFGGSPVQITQKRSRPIDEDGADDADVRAASQTRVSFSLRMDSIFSTLKEEQSFDSEIAGLLEGSNQLYSNLMQNCPSKKCHLAVLLCLHSIRDYYNTEKRLLKQAKRSSSSSSSSSSHKIDSFISGRYMIALVAEHCDTKQVSFEGSSQCLMAALKRFWMYVFSAELNPAECYLHVGICDLEHPIESVLKFLSATNTLSPHYWIEEIRPPVNGAMESSLLYNASMYAFKDMIDWVPERDRQKMIDEYFKRLHENFYCVSLKLCDCKGNYKGKPL